MRDLKHAGSLIKITGAYAVLDQNTPLPYRTKIVDGFPDSIYTP